MGRKEQRKKLVGKARSEFHLNRSISTYGKLQTRLLSDLPNYNWLPSDDSLPISNKSNYVLSNVTNQQPTKKREQKPCKIPIHQDVLDSDSDDDFKPCTVVSQRSRKTRQTKTASETDKGLYTKKKSQMIRRKKKLGKDFNADKENHHSIMHTDCIVIPREERESNPKSIKTLYKTRINFKKKANSQSTPDDGIADISSSKKQDINSDGSSKNKHIPAVPNLAIADDAIFTVPLDSNHPIQEPRSLSLVKANASIDTDKDHQVSVFRVPNFAVPDASIDTGPSDNYENCPLPVSDGLPISATTNPVTDAIDPSIDIMPADNGPSHTDILPHHDINQQLGGSHNSLSNLSINNDDLFGAHASPKIQIPMNNELSADLLSPPSFKMSRSVKNVVLQDASAILHCSNALKSPVCCHSFNSTVIGHAADFEITNDGQRLKLQHSTSSKMGLIQSTPLVSSRTLKINLIPATAPRINLKDSTSTDAVFKGVNMALSKETKTCTKVCESKEVADTKTSKIKPAKGCKPKVVKRNRRKKPQKPKQFSKRIANKCNRSLRSDNNSILQHIMVGNPIKQYQYDFLENSQDAYFVDTSSKSVEGVQLVQKTMKRKSSKENDSDNNIEAIVPANHLTNFSVTELPSDCFKSSGDESQQKVIPNLKSGPCSAKKKCLRKRPRLNYKLMLSGSWYHDDSVNRLAPDHAKSKDISDDVFLIGKDETQNADEDESCDDSFKALRHNFKQGNINQRRKRQMTKPTNDSSLFSPLTLRSRGHLRSNHMQSPQLHICTNQQGTPKQIRGIRTRSPGSHLKTPIRVCSRICINNNSKFNFIAPENIPITSLDLKQQSVSNSIFHSTSNANQSSKVQQQTLGFAKALSAVENVSTSLINESLTEKQKILIECNQVETIEFETVLSDMDSQSCGKLGEGVYGEVYGIQQKDTAERIALKVIPIEGDLTINDERQKTYGEILPEILASKELSKLSDDSDYATDAFIKLHRVHCVKGKYPDILLNAWDTYAEDESTLNDRPNIFDDDQLYILLLYADGGTDVEHYKFRSASQAFSIIQQVCAALAVAEKTLEFEHRDLHWGNVLVTPTKSKEVCVTFDGKCYKIQTCGVKANIIDFTLSRLSKDGVTVFQDLSCDPSIFNGDKDADYQFEVYRLMKQESRNDWSLFCPKSNIFWLHYLILKFVKEVSFSVVKTSRHSSSMSKLRFLSKNILDYISCSAALLSCSKLSM